MKFYNSSRGLWDSKLNIEFPIPRWHQLVYHRWPQRLWHYMDIIYNSRESWEHFVWNHTIFSVCRNEKPFAFPSYPILSTQPETTTNCYDECVPLCACPGVGYTQTGSCTYKWFCPLYLPNRTSRNFFVLDIGNQTYLISFSGRGGWDIRMK